MMLAVSSMAPFHLLGHDDEKEMQHDLFGHVMPMATSMAQLHFFSQDNQNEVQYNFLGHVMLLKLVSVSHNANSVINGTILSARSRG